MGAGRSNKRLVSVSVSNLKPRYGARAVAFWMARDAGLGIGAAARKAGVTNRSATRLEKIRPGGLDGRARGPRTLPDDTRRRFEELRAEGAPVPEAAERVGISPSTGAAWDRRQRLWPLLELGLSVDEAAIQVGISPRLAWKAVTGADLMKLHRTTSAPPRRLGSQPPRLQGRRWVPQTTLEPL